MDYSSICGGLGGATYYVYMVNTCTQNKSMDSSHICLILKLDIEEHISILSLNLPKRSLSFNLNHSIMGRRNASFMMSNFHPHWYLDPCQDYYLVCDPCLLFLFS